jgi:hypothetical protein
MEGRVSYIEPQLKLPQLFLSDSASQMSGLKTPFRSLIFCGAVKDKKDRESLIETLLHLLDREKVSVGDVDAIQSAVDDAEER